MVVDALPIFGPESPQVGGRRRVARRRQGPPVLLTSGTRLQDPPTGMRLLPKPFSVATLHETLDAIDADRVPAGTAPTARAGSQASRQN